jgi:glycosyltransferase involved in cell wall biosynthesis
MNVSIVIVAKKEEKDTQDCIGSIKKQSIKPDEILFISQEKIKIKGVKSIVSKANRSKARNTGWKKAKSNIIIFAEADSVFSKDWIKSILKEFQKGADAVIDRRAVYKPKTYAQKCGDEFFSLRYSHYKPFSAWAFKKSVLKAVNGFDENLEYGEDSDLGNRILNKGFKINLAKKAYQFHKGEPKTFSEVMTRSFNFGKKKANTYFRKYPGQAPIGSSLFIILWFFLLPVAFITLWSLVIFFAIDIFLYLSFIIILFTKIKYYKLKTKYLIGIALMNYYKWFFTTLGYMYGKIRGKR